MNARRRKWIAPGAILLVAVAVAGGALWHAQTRRAVTTRSSEAYGLYWRGLEAMQQYRWDAADSAWAAACTIDSTFAMAWAHRASLSLSVGSTTQAARFQDRAERHPRHLREIERLYLQRVRAEISRDRRAERATIERTLARYPGDIETWYALYGCQLEENRLEPAVNSLRRILEIAPNQYLVYNYLGYLLADLSRTDEALDAFRKYAFVDTDEPNPHDSLGEFYERIGRYDLAEAEYRRALAADSSFYMARVHLARARCAQGRCTDALEATKDPSAGGGSRAARQALRNRTMFTYHYQGRNDRALEMLGEMRDSLLQRDRWFYYRAEFLQRLGDADGVEAMRDSLLRVLGGRDRAKINEADVLAMSVRAMALESRARWSEAADTVAGFARGHYLMWDSKEWLAERLAEDLGRAGRYREAETTAGSLLRVNPANGVGLYWRARSAAALGRESEAREAWARLAEVRRLADPGDSLRLAAQRALVAS